MRDRANMPPTRRERRASTTENSAIFNARHGVGSFHPHQLHINCAGLPKTPKQGILANDPAAIW
jgi:hypothetical protein